MQGRLSRSQTDNRSLRRCGFLFSNNDFRYLVSDRPILAHIESGVDSIFCVRYWPILNLELTVYFADYDRRDFLSTNKNLDDGRRTTKSSSSRV